MTEPHPPTPRSIRLAPRSIRRLSYLILKSRTGLDVISAAFQTLAERTNYKPFHVMYESDYGEMVIASDGNQIQVTWSPPESQLQDACDESEAAHESNDACTGINPSTAKTNNQPLNQSFNQP